MGLTFNLGRISPSVFTDSSLNVGIGAAPSGSYKLEVTGTAKVSSTLLLGGALTGTSATFSGALGISFASGTGSTINLTNTSSASNSNVIETQYNIYDGAVGLSLVASSGVLNPNIGNVNGAFYWKTKFNGSALTTRLYIDQSGNVGIGTTLPSGIVNGSGLVIYDALYPRLILQNSTTGTTTSAYSGMYMIGNDMYVQNPLANLYLGTLAGSSVMKITSGGAVFINTASALPGSGTLLHIDSPTAGPTFKNATTGQQSLMLWNAVSSGDNLLLEFNVNTSIAGKGSIDYNRASNVIRYNTTSDANLKNIIGDSNLEKSIDILNSTRIREYSWKEDETSKPQIGVIAQELYETFKGAVSVGSDKSFLGTEDYKSWKVDKTAFTFHLIAGWQKHEQMIQEQQAQIEELKALIAAK
jgi:hypothetical protein